MGNRVPRPPGPGSDTSPCRTAESAVQYLRDRLEDSADSLLAAAEPFVKAAIRQGYKERPAAEHVRQIVAKAESLSLELANLLQTTLGGPHVGGLLHDASLDLDVLVDCLKDRPSKTTKLGESLIDIDEILAGDPRLSFLMWFSAFLEEGLLTNVVQLTPSEFLAVAVATGIEDPGGSEVLLQDLWGKRCRRVRVIRENLVRLEMTRNNAMLRQKALAVALRNRGKPNGDPDGSEQP